MARGHDSADRRATREADRDAEAGETGVENEATEAEEQEDESHPRPELRWVQLRQPKHAIEIGQNGRILASHYHSGYDAWEVLLETYEGELSE